MCLFPKYILNPKYLPNKKNGGVIPPLHDYRKRYVQAACGKCYECRRQKARGWQVRMSEELRVHPNAYFITLTLDDDNYKKLLKEYKSKTSVSKRENIIENGVAKLALRKWLERVRKAKKTSIKHWFITELGHENTKRLHLHGIVWDIDGGEMAKNHWKYGFVYIGDYVNERTTNYIIKYMLKPDEENKDFEGKVLCSPGIGKYYTEREDAKNNAYKGKNTNQTYRFKNGIKVNLPTYYKNKIYTEAQRDKLFSYMLDKEECWVMGEKTKIGSSEYVKLLQYHQNRARRILGDEKTYQYLERKKEQTISKRAKTVSEMDRFRNESRAKQAEMLKEWNLKKRDSIDNELPFGM